MTMQNEQDYFDALIKELAYTDGKRLGHSERLHCAHPLPSMQQVTEGVEILRSILFPGYFGNGEHFGEKLKYHLGEALTRAEKIFCEQIQCGLCFNCSNNETAKECQEKAAQITQEFIKQLTSIRTQLLTDAKAGFEGDPAATSIDEIIFCYPGFNAITNYRIAHELYLRNVPILPRMITEHAHSNTGIDIHPGATIGEYFFIDHGTGVVIGETCILGNNVRIYQGVTLGARSFPLDENGKPIKGIPRHPILENDVVVYAGATILGRITVGKGSVIGGNVWLTKDLPPGSSITQNQA